MSNRRSHLATALIALAAPALVAGCGGSESSDEDPQQVVEETFSNDQTITSGVLDLSFNVSAGDQGSLDVSLNGPFQGDADDPTAFPQLDLTATASGSGQGQSIEFEGGLIATTDNAFVEYEGETYEVGSETFDQFKQAAQQGAEQSQQESGEDAAASFREGCEQAIEAQGGDPKACDFDVGAWFTNLTNEGTEDVGGSEAVHISGELDVAQFVEDFAGLATSVPGAQAPSEQELSQVSDAISEASFDLFSGQDDRILRQLDVSLVIDPSGIQGAALVPVDSIDFGFSLSFSDVNSEQTIDAPSDAKPIEDLVGQLGIPGLGLGGLGGLGGGGDLEGLDGSGGGGSGGAGAGGAGAGDSDAYLDCIAEAGNDTEKAAECLNEL